MFTTSRMKWPGAVMVAPFALLLAAGLARAQSFSAPLVQCTSVAKPAALTNCAAVNDPLKRGVATINDMGDVTVAIAGTATNTTYAVSFVSGDGSQSTSLGNLTTNNKGDGAFRHDAFFKFGVVGAGNVVLSGGGFEEFVTGISISSNGLESAADFQPALVRCADVAVPGALSSCGNDPLNSGRADVENDDGALSIHVNGARPNSSYSAILRAPNGTTTALGTVGPTDNHGNATLIVPAEFAASTIGSGSIVLQSSSVDQFVSGFKVNQKFVRPAVSVSNLVRCADVTDPVGLVCGSDPLDSGAYDVNATGQITIKVTGAEPSTNYEVFFRPLDNSGDVDTGIAVATNALGNAEAGPHSFFAANTVASGTLVVKHSGSGQPDEFVAGFKVH
jgi:hypothetical protein